MPARLCMGCGSNNLTHIFTHTHLPVMADVPCLRLMVTVCYSPGQQPHGLQPTDPMLPDRCLLSGRARIPAQDKHFDYRMDV